MKNSYRVSFGVIENDFIVIVMHIEAPTYKGDVV